MQLLPLFTPFLGYIYETAGYAHMRFQVPLRVYFEQHRMACSAIWHLVELCHENRGLSGARTMVAVENDRCLLFEDHVQGEVMALMKSTRPRTPLGIIPSPLREDPCGITPPRRGCNPTISTAMGPCSCTGCMQRLMTVSYTHLRAHETRHDLVCRLLLEKKK